MSRLRPLALALLLGTTPTAGLRAEATGSFERADQVVLPTSSEAPEAVDGAGGPEVPPIDALDAPDSGTSAAEEPAPDDAAVKRAATPPSNPFEGEAGRPVKRRAPPLDAKNPVPPELALMRRARLGDTGMLEVSTPEGVRALTVDPVLQRQLTHVMSSYRTPHAAAALKEEAERFGFNRSIPFAIPVEPSEANIPESAFAFAETGAGFGDVYLSPLHGALIAATIANGGVWRDPTLFEALPALPGTGTVQEGPAESRAPGLAPVATSDREGAADALAEEGALVASAAAADTPTLPNGEAGAVPKDPTRRALQASLGTAESLAIAGPDGETAEDGVRIMDAEQAAALAEILEATVTRGTARRVFNERGYRVEGAVGKTGTLADRKPFRDYSWFIGYAPKDNPRVAVAVVVVNDPVWHIRATWLGREAMRLALARLEGEVAHVVSAAPAAVPVLTPEPLP